MCERGIWQVWWCLIAVSHINGSGDAHDFFYLHCYDLRKKADKSGCECSRVGESIMCP